MNHFFCAHRQFTEEMDATCEDVVRTHHLIRDKHLLMPICDSQVQRLYTAMHLCFSHDLDLLLYVFSFCLIKPAFFDPPLLHLICPVQPWPLCITLPSLRTNYWTKLSQNPKKQFHFLHFLFTFIHFRLALKRLNMLLLVLLLNARLLLGCCSPTSGKWRWVQS